MILHATINQVSLLILSASQLGPALKIFTMKNIVYYLNHHRVLLNMPDLQFTGRSLLAVNVINEQQHGGDI